MGVGATERKKEGKTYFVTTRTGKFGDENTLETYGGGGGNHLQR